MKILSSFSSWILVSYLDVTYWRDNTGNTHEGGCLDYKRIEDTLGGCTMDDLQIKYNSSRTVLRAGKVWIVESISYYNCRYKIVQQ